MTQNTHLLSAVQVGAWIADALAETLVRHFLQGKRDMTTRGMRPRSHERYLYELLCAGDGDLAADLLHEPAVVGGNLCAGAVRGEAGVVGHSGEMVVVGVISKSLQRWALNGAQSVHVISEQ